MDTQIFDKVENPKNDNKNENGTMDNMNEQKTKDIDTESLHKDIPDLKSVNSGDEPVDLEVDNEDDTRKKRKKKKEKKASKDGASGFVTNLFDWASALLFALIIVMILMTFCFRLVDVDGDSMLQTLQDQNKLIVTGLNYTPEVGDIVVISHGAELDKTLVKRVIAVSGQTVDINSETGDVIVDGIVIEENYINGKTTQIGDMEFPVEVEEGTVFVLGDNRPISKDSRFTEVGLIDNDAIIGKVRFRIYPIDEIGKVE